MTDGDVTPARLTSQLSELVAAAAPEALPSVLGALERARAEAWARLTSAAVIPPEPPLLDRLLTPEEALALVGGAPPRSLQWLFDRTRGKAFRRNLSRKVIRFEERGFRAWLGSRPNRRS